MYRPSHSTPLICLALFLSLVRCSDDNVMGSTVSFVDPAASPVPDSARIETVEVPNHEIQFTRVCRLAERLYYVALRSPELRVIVPQRKLQPSRTVWRLDLPKGNLPPSYSVQVPGDVIAELSTGERESLAVAICEKETAGGADRCLDPVPGHSAAGGLRGTAPSSESVSIHYKKIPNLDAADSSCDERMRSPLVLDLDGDGTPFSGPEDGPSFDADGDGYAESTGWTTSPRDPLLALDRNRNGTIDDGRELFGNSMSLPSGAKAANGFLALAQFDRNRDGIISPGDPIFPELLLWEDADLDARVDDGELVPLDAEGVESISLRYSEVYRLDRHGNEIRQISTFRRLGVIGNIVDVWFRTLR